MLCGLFLLFGLFIDLCFGWIVCLTVVGVWGWVLLFLGLFVLKDCIRYVCWFLFCVCVIFWGFCLLLCVLMFCGFVGLWVVSVSLFFGLVITRVLGFVVICYVWLFWGLIGWLDCFDGWCDGLV